VQQIGKEKKESSKEESNKEKEKEEVMHRKRLLYL